MRNMLLASVPPDELGGFMRSLSRAELSVGQCLQTEGDRVARVYFPESGLVSLMGGREGRDIEAAMVGREGMIGACALLGDAVSSHQAIVRVPGTAWTLSGSELKPILAKLPGLHACLLGFVGTWTTHMEQTIYATGRCTVQQRVARWLLLAHDSLGDREFEITHDCLATMLGVRRPGVTVALHVLEGELAIRSTRGRIAIRDRDRLKGIADDAYCEPQSDIPPRQGQYIPNGSALSNYELAIVQ